MKRPKTICIIMEYCDICGKEARGTKWILDGIVYCGEKDCNDLAHKILKMDRVKREIKRQLYF